MTQLRIINATDVQQHLSYAKSIAAVERSMKAVAADKVTLPLRTFLPMDEGNSQLLMMPAASSALPVFGHKTISILTDNPAKGFPAIQGYISLLDADSGAPCALIEGASVTAIRTAAASAAASKQLARHDAKTHAILGTGVQARSHARAMLEVRPEIERTMIWGRDMAKAESLAEELTDTLGCSVLAATLEEACRADIISAVTASATPLIERDAVHPGVHINLVGSHQPDRREASSALMAAVKLFVDHLPAALSEAGDIIMPIEEGVFGADHILAEIGDILSGTTAFTRAPDEITIYKSLGNAAQDLFVAHALFEAAQTDGFGQTVTL